MTTDFNKPIAEDQFLDVLTEIRDKLAALAKQDLSAASNVPEGAVQFSAANRRWEKRMGAVWTALSPLTQTLDVKVHDSARLADKEPDYYRNANNINNGTLDVARLDTESTDYNSPSTTKVARLSALRALYNWIRGQLQTHTHSAQQITGILAQDRIPNLPASKITRGALTPSRIPDLPADKITHGALSQARIPRLPADKITSGTLSQARIPSLSANKITAGVLNESRIPDTIDVRGIETVQIATHTVGRQSTVTGVALSASIYKRELTLTLTITRPSPPKATKKVKEVRPSLDGHR